MECKIIDQANKRIEGLRAQLECLRAQVQERNYQTERGDRLQGQVSLLRQGLREVQIEAEVPTRGDEYQRLLQAEHQLSRIAAHAKLTLEAE